IIANELAKRYYQVSILSLSNGVDSFFKLNESIGLYSLYSQKVSMKKNFIGCCFKIRKFVQQHKIDTLIVVDSISCIFSVPAIWGLKVKHICWEHFNFNVNLGVKFRDIGRQLAARYCDIVVTLTKRDKELWKAGLKKINAKIVDIANPTPYENIDNIPSLEYKNILAMGRLTFQKGFDLLIQAWAEIYKYNKDWTLTIVGSGEDENKLKKLSLDLGVNEGVKFICATKNVEQYFKAASFFCLSSRFEGFGMVLVEAQSFSLPIVSFNCDAGPSDIIDNDENGYLVETGNIKMLHNKLLKLMNLDSSQYILMSEKSKIKSEKFFILNIGNKWVEIL
uniref:glycosyltransferase family 4 protein n=1 Tax=Acinetobacter bereziniae TaxID=106648 RepID=UPI00124FB0F2